MSTMSARTQEVMAAAKERIHDDVMSGKVVRCYDVALSFNLSEFHFARQFRIAFGRSPHVFYDEVRVARARALMAEGMSEGKAARSIGLRRPAELRALIAKRGPNEAELRPEAPYGEAP